MKHALGGLWRRGLQAMTQLLAPFHTQRAIARDDALDWAHASAAGEEDPGASVDLLDVRLPPTVKGDGPPPR